MKKKGMSVIILFTFIVTLIFDAISLGEVRAAGKNIFKPNATLTGLGTSLSSVIIKGYVYDEDNVDKSLKVIITVGGKLNDAGVEKYYTIANLYDSYGNKSITTISGKTVQTGNYHGFHVQEGDFISNRYGVQKLYIYAENTDSESVDHVNSYTTIYSGSIEICGHYSYQHNWTAGDITKQATCVEEGILTKTCTVCRRESKESIPALGHTFIIDKAVPATTTSEGKTEGSHCSRCGMVYVEQKSIPKIEKGDKSENNGEYGIGISAIKTSSKKYKALYNYYANSIEIRKKNGILVDKIYVKGAKIDSMMDFKGDVAYFTAKVGSIYYLYSKNVLNGKLKKLKKFDKYDLYSVASVYKNNVYISVC